MMAALTAHLWESTLFALAATCATLLFRSNGAHVRYWLWFAASCKFLIPFSVLAAIGRQLGPQSMAVTTPDSVVVVIQALSAPGAVPAVMHAPANSAGMIDWASVLVALWAAGFITVLAIWTMRWLRIRSALRTAIPAPLDAPIPVRMTATHIGPGLVGIVRPVLLLPATMTTYLTAQELRAILAHELCHLRRRDNLTAAIHMLVQALFWFHPLLWWIGTRLMAERERACDEAVARSGALPEVYAEGILKVCKLHVGSPLMCASGVAGANLKQRIERIIGNKSAQTLGVPKSISLAAAMAMLLAGPMLFGWASAHGPSQNTLSTAAPSKQSRHDVRAARIDIGERNAPSSPQTAAPKNLTAPAGPASETAPPPVPATEPLPVGASGFTRAGLNSGPALSLTNFAAADEVVEARLAFPAACPIMVGYGEFGATDLTFTVEADGSVGKVVVDSSSGYPWLDEAFGKALGKSRVVPGTVNGKPRAMTITVTMEAKAVGTRTGDTYSMFVTVKRGSLPRVATYNCRFQDRNPFDPLLALQHRR